MQIRSAIRSFLGVTFLLSGVFLLLGAIGCSEDDVVSTDEVPPQVSIESPRSTSISPFSIKDSTWMLVLASDNNGIQSLEVWCTFHADSSRLITRSLSAVPDSAGYYRYHWFTEGIQNGSDGEIWARATDGVGNVASSEPIPVTVIKTDDIKPPDADFAVSPGLTGAAEVDVFAFDPSYTTDDLETDDELTVRWDFEGDGVWDLNADWLNNPNPLYTADYTVSHVYPTPGVYPVTMEVKNSYEERTSTKVKEITVEPEGGDPKPQGEQILISAGTYPIGVLNVDHLNPGTNGYNSDEYSDSLNIDLEPGSDPRVAQVVIGNDFNIDKYEVSNAFYVTFLNIFMLERLWPYEEEWVQHIFYEPADEEPFVRWDLDGPILVELLGSSRIKFLNPIDGFFVDAEYAQHPVTGVTWEGARTFAASYGLRLPTEIEWEVVAHALHVDDVNTPEYIYPWVDHTVINGMWANYSGSGDPFESIDPSKATTEVGAYNGGFIGSSFAVEDAVGSFGTYDMAGNVSEWTKDWYSDTTYDILFHDNLPSPIDPQGPTIGTFRVIRGGNFADEARNVRVTRRSGLPPTEMSPKVGFRTVHTPYARKR